MSETPAPHHTLRNAVLALLAILAISVGLWMSVPPAPPVAGAATAEPKPGSLPVVKDLGGDFRLPATTGQDIALADLRGKVVLLNFGFTHCPDVCPMVLTRMGNALREMREQGVDINRVQPLFVTFDPARDTLDHLREYVSFFYPTMIGMRGDDAQTKAVAKQFKVVYLAQDTGSEGGYVFMHSDYVYVIDTQGRVRLLVGSKDPEIAIVEAVKALLREADAK
jgi:protein SCO1/2